MSIYDVTMSHLTPAMIASQRAIPDVVIHTLRVPLARMVSTLTTAGQATLSAEDTAAARRQLALKHLSAGLVWEGVRRDQLELIAPPCSHHVSASIVPHLAGEYRLHGLPSYSTLGWPRQQSKSAFLQKSI